MGWLSGILSGGNSDDEVENDDGVKEHRETIWWGNSGK